MVWNCSVIPAYGRWRQEDDCEFETTHSYIVNSRPAWDTKWDLSPNRNKNKNFTKQSLKLSGESLEATILELKWSVCSEVYFRSNVKWKNPSSHPIPTLTVPHSVCCLALADPCTGRRLLSRKLLVYRTHFILWHRVVLRSQACCCVKGQRWNTGT